MRVPLLLPKEGIKFYVSLNEISSEEGKLASRSIILEIIIVELPP